MSEGRIMRASQLLGREAVDIDSGTCAGIVRDLLLTRAGQLVCAGIQPAEWYAPGLACPPEAIVAASRGRLLYGGCGPLRRLRPAHGRKSSMWSFLALKPLVSRTGELLGTLEDLAFDLPSGRLVSALVSQEHGPLEEFRVSRLTASGPDCVIAEIWVAEEPSAAAAGAAEDADEASLQAESVPVEPVLFDESGAVFAAAVGAWAPEARAATSTMPDQAGSAEPFGEFPESEAGAETAPEPGTETEPVAEPDQEAGYPVPEVHAPHPLLPRQPSPEELNARLAEMILATAASAAGGAEADSGSPEEAGVGAADAAWVARRSTEPQPSPFQPLEALVAQREARARQRLPEAGLPAGEDMPQLFADSQLRDSLDKLRPFDQRKVLFLTGRAATRDIYSPAGPLLARSGEELTRPVLTRIIEAGELDSVFLEHAAVTR